MSEPTSTHYAHSEYAERNRVKKAHTLARWLYERDMSAAHLYAATPPLLRAWARAAGVTPPSTMETWDATVDALDVLEGWAEANPDHPAAARPHVAERAAWLTTDEPPTEPAQAEPLATVTALPTRQDAPVADDQPQDAPEAAPPATAPADAPRGWDVCVQLGPIPRKDAVCPCGKRAVTATLTRWRCATCPPKAGEWGHLLDHTPHDVSGHPDTPHRCYEPRCPAFTLATVAPPTVARDDDRPRRRRR